MGYEVIIKSLTDARLLDICVPVVYGSSRAFGFYKKQLPDTDSLNTNIINTAKDFHPKRVNIINCVPDNFRIDPGQPAPESANAALIALTEAVKDLRKDLQDTPSSLSTSSESRTVLCSWLPTR